MSVLVNDWKQAYKMYSVWFIAIIGAFPDIWNLLIQYHVVDSTDLPTFYVRIVNLIAVLGIVSRLVQQKVNDQTGKLSISPAVVK